MQGKYAHSKEFSNSFLPVKFLSWNSYSECKFRSCENDMQSAERRKTKVKYKLLSFGWEPRNQVPEGATSQRCPPTQRKNKRVYSCNRSAWLPPITKLFCSFSQSFYYNNVFYQHLVITKIHLFIGGIGLVRTSCEDIFIS